LRDPFIHKCFSIHRHRLRQRKNKYAETYHFDFFPFQMERACDPLDTQNIISRNMFCVLDTWSGLLELLDTQI